MTGARTIPVRFTVAQWDVLLAALGRAETEWQAEADRGDTLAARNVQTVTRARAALVAGWTDGSRMARP